MKKSNISKKEKRSSSVEEYISKITTPIFEKALQETKKNHVSVGSGQVEDTFSYSFYNPHNARYYFKFDKKSLSKKPRGGVGSFYKDLKTINSTELCNGDFHGCRVVVKKHLIEVTNKINKERLIAIDGSEDNRDKLIKESIAMMMHECIDVLYKFIKIYGGNSNYICVNHHVLDNKILHDKIIDTIPLKTTFRNDVAKNVYKTSPPNIELSDPAYASNFVRNMGLYDYSPAIAGELGSLRSEFERFEVEALKPLTDQIVLHLEVQRKTLLVQEDTLLMLKELREGFGFFNNIKKLIKYVRGK